MEVNVSEWLNLIVRWFHVIAGVMWIGQTFLFNWLEKRLALASSASEDPNVSGKLWMVHGGGFYLLEKQKTPKEMPRELYWFKYESLLTWVSGFLLLFIVYYYGGLMLEPDSELSDLTGVLIGLGTLVGGWILYNLIWYTPLGKNEYLGASISLAVIIGFSYLLDNFISSRAVLMHVGAVFGTIMVCNVWFRILPAQDEMLSATRAGKKPNMELAVKAKNCSKHNTFLSVPLILIMISNHFPTATYGNQNNWLVLGFLVVLGWVIASFIRNH